MYREYTTRNLNEYHKLVEVVHSCKNLEQFEVVKNMVEQFGRNCDFRDSKLKVRIWRTLSLNAYKEYKSYNRTAHLQVEEIVGICNMWVEQYSAWEAAEMKAAEEEKEASKKLPPKKNIAGFGTLLKKNKKKKNG